MSTVCSFISYDKFRDAFVADNNKLVYTSFQNSDADKRRREGEGSGKSGHLQTEGGRVEKSEHFADVLYLSPLGIDLNILQ